MLPDRFNLTHFLLIIAIIVTLFYAFGSVYGSISGTLGEQEAKVAEITISGPIVSGGGITRDQVTPEGIRNLIQKAKDDNADAFLFRINSPGGAVIPSKDLAKLIGSIDSPTVCLMEDVAASGAYWAATECDHIIADPLTITGSIGVKASYLEFSGLLQRYGVQYVNITAGRFKDAGTPYKNLTAKERELFMDQLNTIHQAFIKAVAENRNMSVENITKYATGQTYLGSRAAEIGLIDETGGRKDALAYLRNQTGKNLTVEEYEAEQRLDLISLLLRQVGYGIGQAMKDTGIQRALETDSTIYS